MIAHQLLLNNNHQQLVMLDQLMDGSCDLLTNHVIYCHSFS